MADIEIRVPFEVGRDEARAAAEKGLARMAAKMGLDVRWIGDRAEVAGTGIKACAVTIAEREVAIEVTLALMAKPMKGLIEQQIRQGIEKALAG